MCKINLFVKPLIWGFSVLKLSKDSFMAVILGKIRMLYVFLSFFKEIEVSKEVRFLVLFPFRDLSRSWIKFYEDCDSISLNLRSSIKLEVFDCKRLFS